MKSIKWSKSFSLMLSLVIGMLGAYLILDYYARIKSDRNLNDFALGTETSEYLANHNGRQIHCFGLEDFNQCKGGYLAANIKDVVMWLGNSQLHAINQMQKGDETAAPILHRHFSAYDYYFITFSQPNANLQEHYLFFEYTLNHFPLKALVLPVVFDDMRETGIRYTLEEGLANERVAAQLIRTSTGKQLIANYGDKDMAGNDTAALKDTYQARTEKFLNERLASHSAIWSARGRMREHFFLALYTFRNWVFQINPSSIRKMIYGNYVHNREAFEDLLKVARRRNIKVLVYIAPLRSDVPAPYDPRDYAFFKGEIKSISERFGARFVNLENLVPGDYWGTTGSTSVGKKPELDFMHFKAAGHELLAGRILTELLSLLEMES